MAGIIRMETALKNFEKSGKIAKITDNGSYRITIIRQSEKSADGQYLYVIEVHKVVAKGEKAPEKPELALRYDNLTKALTVANQALKGGLETMLLFHKPNVQF